MKYREIKGDLITLAKEGEFDVIAHGCNCFCRMKRGIAPQMAEAFGCDMFNLETKSLWEGDINKLGQIEYNWINIKDKNSTSYTKNDIHALAVVNAYTQYHWDTNTKPLDYEALTLCLRKINHIFKDMHIGLPLIGCHLAGGVWDWTKLKSDTLQDKILKNKFSVGIKKDVKTIIQQELRDMNITIVHYNQ